MKCKYNWQYCSLGGVVRVRIANGEDIAHLGELDQKLWTALSAPIDDLNLDPQTLHMLDTDNDGKIRVAEIVSAAQWLTSVIKDKDCILKGDSVLPLDQINTEIPEGKALYVSAKQILRNLAKESDEISVAEASDSVAIFKGTKFNGDGIITPASADEDSLKAVIADAIASVGSAVDRSGEAGLNADFIETFYKACADYSAWQAAAEADREKIFPYGDNTAAALEACNALKDKVSDFFTRCKLLKYDATAAAAVAVSVSSLEDISICPIALPNEEGILKLDAVNPAWQAAVSKLSALVPEFAAKKGIDEADWSAICSSFSAYSSWVGAKAGSAVEALGLEKVNAILKEDSKQTLLDLVAKDLELTAEANSIDEVKKLMLYYRDFFKLLKNYVVFSEFYDRSHCERSLFEIGKLYVDQRCCDLCLRVSDMSKHADMAKLSGMFLIYCKCSSVKLGKSMDIVAVLTEGSISDLRPGKNGIFYDCKGNDWDATITKVVDNPISIKQAFWDPYRKFWEFCVGLINKSAADKDKKMLADMQAKASTAVATSPAAAAPAAAKPAPFDIAKFAGIFAAIGLAIGAIGDFFVSVAKGVASAEWWELLLVIAAILLVISGPSCFIAWGKLRKRDLGPVLNANGWAINSRVIVNILFGAKLTSTAKYPVALNLPDPYKKKKCAAWKWILAIVVILAITFGILYLTGNLGFLGL